MPLWRSRAIGSAAEKGSRREAGWRQFHGQTSLLTADAAAATAADRGGEGWRGVGGEEMRGIAGNREAKERQEMYPSLRGLLAE